MKRGLYLPAPDGYVYEDDLDKILNLLRAGVPVRHGSVLRSEQQRQQRELAKTENRRLRRLERKKAKAREKQAAKRVYVFAAGPYIKVGVANDVEARWRSIRGHNPLLERPLYIGVPLGPTAFECEREIHRQLGRYRRKGTEWFRCGRFLAIETVLQITGESP